MWQFLHLYDPRTMVPQSLMPSFPWYFETLDRDDPRARDHPFAMVPCPGFLPEGKVLIPTEEAIDRVAYLRSLRQ